MTSVSPILGTVTLAGLAAALAPARVSLAELAATERLVSTPDALSELDFTHAHIATDAEQMFAMAAETARRALADAGFTAADVSAVLWAGALPAGHVQAGRHASSPLARFNASASRLQEELGLDRAVVQGVAQQGCCGLFAALRTARALLLAEPDWDHVLCVGADHLPPDSPRELLYNVISDAAAAVVVSRARPGLAWRAFHQVSKGYYWDVPARQKEIIAAYYPTSRLVIGELLARAGLKPADITHVLPTGIGAGSWPILMELCGLPAGRLAPAAGSFGHTVAADPFLHLQALRTGGGVRPGDRLLLFSYGFGSSWAGLVLEEVAS